MRIREQYLSHQITFGNLMDQVSLFNMKQNVKLMGKTSWPIFYAGDISCKSEQVT